MADLTIHSLGNSGIGNPLQTGKNSAHGSASFGDLLTEALADTNKLQQQSNEAVQKLLAGEVQDVHTALIAVQKADLSFQMMMQVKNKLVAAYEEVMRMQV